MSHYPAPMDRFDAGLERYRGRSVDLACLRRAIERSWSSDTAYGGLMQSANPAAGQCYPTSRVVQWFYPDFDIARGEVWTGTGTECHFWNVRGAGPAFERLDLSWQQFPDGSTVRSFEVLDRTKLGDSPATLSRCGRLLRRVLDHLRIEGFADFGGPAPAAVPSTADGFS